MTFGTTARLLHWIMAVLVLAMIAAGLIMTQEIERPLQDRLFIFHKSCGAILLVLVAFRIAWRLTHPAPPLPDSVPPLQKLAAYATHLGLYVFLVVMAVSGYVRVTSGGFPIDLLDAIGIEPLLSRDEARAEQAKFIHATAKYGLIVLIALHVAAAAFHGLVLKDGVFSRMWPPVRPAKQDG
ncbi:MAG: cytochrome b [Rhizobiaceae bacterium]|nr:cytochrome b [Rhizobiaceae bacterium]MCV0404808.1 cytochrome b [Rhizobiaceae bacterium]